MAQQILHLQAPAKINLHLRITGRRPGGYHLLDSRMQKLEFCDELAFERLDRGIELVFILYYCPVKCVSLFIVIMVYFGRNKDH